LKLIGIDGCPGGWISASADPSLASVTFTIHADLTSIFSNAVHDGDIVVIDIPIGLALNGPRACDLAAREYLRGSRKSCVFPAPCQATSDATAFGITYREACDVNFGAGGKKVSRQLFAILPKIHEVDRLISPPMQNRIREAHPEVTFAALDRPRPGPLAPKREPQGQIQRLALIRRHVRDVDRLGLEEQRLRLGAGKVSIDDLVDALACLITASRVMNTTAFSLPSGQVEINARGLRMEIVA
jgi:predicted RNase H-like nuclease